jgi:hypothetical protein
MGSDERAIRDVHTTWIDAGHRISIYRKPPDGRWLLARDANTLSLVAN